MSINQPQLKTDMAMVPPGGVGTTLAWPDDDFIRELGEKIVSLTLVEAVQLSDYLAQKHGLRPYRGPNGCHINRGAA